jgi:hypothetical protein
VTKNILLGNHAADQQERYLAAFKAMASMHFNHFESVIARRLDYYFNRASGEPLGFDRLIELIRNVSELAGYLTELQQTQLEAHLNSLSHLSDDRRAKLIGNAFEIESLRQLALSQIPSLQAHHVLSLVRTTDSPDFVPIVLEAYQGSVNFDTANKLSEALKRLIRHMSTDHFVAVIRAGHENNQVSGSFGWSELIAAGVASQIITTDDIEAQLAQLADPVLLRHTLVHAGILAADPASA